MPVVANSDGATRCAMPSWGCRVTAVNSPVYAQSVELIADIRVNRESGRHVETALNLVAQAHARNAAPIERRREFWLQPQRGIEVGNCTVEMGQLEIGKTATIEGIHKVRLNFQRRVAIPHSRIHLAEHDSRPAAIVESPDIIRIEPNGFA